MNKKNEKRPGLRALFFGLIAIAVVLTIVPRVITVYDLSERKGLLEQQKDQLSQENADLEKNMQDINSPENIEKIAREQLGLVKRGETTIIRVLPEESSVSTQ